MITPRPPRRDPISDRHFKPLETADSVSDLSFYVAAALSFAALLIDNTDSPVLYALVQSLFFLAVLAGFVVGIATKLYWRPIAEDQRRADLISNATSIAVTVLRTEGYYNNEEVDPLRRLGLIIMENSYFTRAIVLKMLYRERIFVGGYIALFLIALLYRKTDLALLAVAAQALFSEQVLSRWLRLEWLSARSEKVFEQTYLVFQRPPSTEVLFAKILEIYGLYETSKANAGISLSSRIFYSNNSHLSAEWEAIKATLKL